MTLQEKYEKQKEINKELVDENEALKFAARMSGKVEKQLREENEKLKKQIEQMQDAKCISCTDLGGMLLKITDLEKENAELKKKCYKKAVKDYCELEKENEQLKSVADFQQSSNMKRYFEIQKLEKENKELKQKLEYRNCVNCSNHHSNIKFIKAKEIIKEFVSWANWEGTNCPNFQDIQNKAEQFLEEEA